MNDYIKEVLDVINNRQVTVSMITKYGGLLIEHCNVDVEGENNEYLIFYHKYSRLRLNINRIRQIQCRDNIIDIDLEGLDELTIYCLGK